MSMPSGWVGSEAGFIPAAQARGLNPDPAAGAASGESAGIMVVASSDPVLAAGGEGSVEVGDEGATEGAGPALAAADVADAGAAPAMERPIAAAEVAAAIVSDRAKKTRRTNRTPGEGRPDHDAARFPRFRRLRLASDGPDLGKHSVFMSPRRTVALRAGSVNLSARILRFRRAKASEHGDAPPSQPDDLGAIGEIRTRLIHVQPVRLRGAQSRSHAQIGVGHRRLTVAVRVATRPSVTKS